MSNVLLGAVANVCSLPDRLSPSSSAAWKYGNAMHHVWRALSTMLSYEDALRVAEALEAYADKMMMEHRSNVAIREAGK